ncbi:LytTR family DNA-binding domain-containing protein [soil metagenome]
MIRCIAIDDEDLARELLEDYISKINFLELVSVHDNPVDAIKVIEQENIDLVFIDIQMPELSGLQLIESMTVKPMFILVTAYEKYALESYNLSVVDYLVKPVPFERFLKACNKAMELHRLKTKNVTEETLVRGANHFFIYVDYSHVKVMFDDITYVEGLKDYVKIHLKNSNHPIVARMTMKALEDELPATKFLRIQKSYIVSKEAVTSLRKNSIFIGETELPIGESYKDEVSLLVGKTPE